jgi:hypothetical protein
MPDANDQTPTWRLAMVSDTSGTPGRWSIILGESISEEDYASCHASTGLIDEILRSSSFGALQTRYNEFKDTIEQIADNFANGRAVPASLHTIEGSLEDVLIGLRRFHDRTSHALSQRYGKTSPEFAAFQDALSYEFDNVFAYRFAWHLRNYSDHQQNAISRISEDSRADANGSVQRHFAALFNSRILLSNYAWHRMVRPDLERINGEFPVEPVVDSLMHSCRRAYCKTLLAQESHITEAVENIKSLVNRNLPYGGSATAFARVSSSDRTNLEIEPISIELTDVAEQALREARAEVT